MNTKALSKYLILSLSISLCSCRQPCTSSLKLFEAVEFARRRPRIVAQDFWRVQMKQGTRNGKGNDPTCAKEAYEYMNKFPSNPKHMMISNTLNLATAYTVSLTMETGKGGHMVAGTRARDRIERFSKRRGLFNEALVGGADSKHDMTCMFIVKFFIMDISKWGGRGHRDGMMNITGKYSVMGCYSNGKVAAIMLAKKAELKPEYNRDYPELGIYKKYELHTIDDASLFNDSDDSQWKWF